VVETRILLGETLHQKMSLFILFAWDLTGLNVAVGAWNLWERYT